MTRTRMSYDELQKILKKHKLWLYDCEYGSRANLSYADLSGVDLHDANLCCADLRNADLRQAVLYGADLRDAILHNADLSGADLRGIDLSNADLHGANLRLADLRFANLSNSNLGDAKNVPFIPMACPDFGEFIAWKKAKGYIVRLLVPFDAKRSSATGRKCRCDKAKVLSIENADGTPAHVNAVRSDYDESFIYKVGETVTVKNFCDDRFNECTEGIHFFINRNEAVEYRL